MRFKTTIEFADFGPDELTQIIMTMMAEHHFTVPEVTRLEIVRLMTKIRAGRDRNFGNGRTARNVFEAILERMAHRLSDANLTREELTTVLREDVPDAGEFTRRRGSFRTGSAIAGRRRPISPKDKAAGRSAVPAAPIRLRSVPPERR